MEFIKVIADLGGTAFIGYLMYKLASNHMHHNTDAMHKNTKVLDKIATKLEYSEERESKILQILEKILSKL